MTYTAIPDGDIAAGKPGANGTDTLAELWRVNGVDLRVQQEAGHELDGSGYVAHPPLELSTSWAPVGLFTVAGEVARAIPNGPETFDLGALALTSASYGSVYLPFYGIAAAGAGEGVFLRGFRLTPTNIHAIMEGEILGGGAPTGTYNLRIWQMPVDGQDAAITAVFETIDDSEVSYNSPLTDGFLAKLKARDEYVYQLLTSQHSAAGVHKHGLRQMKATQLLAKTGLVADPAGTDPVLIACTWYGDAVPMIECFTAGDGDTSIDISYGIEYTGGTTWRPVLVCRLVAGGTVTSNYQIRVWGLSRI